MRHSLLAAWLLLSLPAFASAAEPIKPLDRFADPIPSAERVPFATDPTFLRRGEVVVLTGPTHGVFEQQQGWLETLLAASAKDHKPVFRNMCWEGDTVFEQWRPMNFGKWGEQFDAVGASTLVAWFGQLEALDDTKNETDFAAAYGKLLDEFQKITPRVVVIGPTPFQKPPYALIRDNTGRNARVKAHNDAARKLAEARGLKFVDLFAVVEAAPLASDNGIHFTPEGQRAVSLLIAKQLGVATPWNDHLEPLRRQIVQKNRLWFDCWRTMNWYFSFGDRTQTSFDKPAGGHPLLAKELEQYKPLIRTADARVQAIALGHQDIPEMPKPKLDPEQARRPPEEEQKTFVLRKGFDINLYASEANDLVKPIQMQWDERGRMWAICAPSYPQLIPGQTPIDYLVVCEDTDGDGRVDKSDRFAEGLVMPTGFALGDGGVYVCEATQLVHLRDRNGDGKADERRVLFSGFGTGDSHQCINSLVWGPDGCLWFTQGLHNFSLVETTRGLSRCHKTGIWRLNPRTLALDHFLSNAAASENAWGVGFDDWGQTFYTPGNEPGAFYIEPALVPSNDKPAEGHYRTLGRLALTKAKGMRADFFGSSHLPDELQGAYVKSVYIASYVELHRFNDAGAGFVSESLGDLIQSPSNAFRPVETKVGPDGAIYVCDWYNPIIGHYQASYRDPNRDHVHGRVWRMTAQGRPLLKPPALANMQPAELIEQLNSPERWNREQAKRALCELGAKALPDLDAKLARVKALEAPVAARFLFEAAGIYAAQEAIRPALVHEMLASPEPRLRAFGVHMLGLWADRIPEALSLLRQTARDDSPRVRMETIVAATYIPSAEAMEVATLALEKPRDKFIDYALVLAVRALKSKWYPALARGELRFDNQPDRLRAVLEADGTKDVAGFVRKQAASAELPVEARERLLALLVNVGSPDDLRFALDQAGKSPAVLSELAAVGGIHKKRPSGDLIPVVQALLAEKDDSLRAVGVRLAGVWKATALKGDIRTTLAESKTPAVTLAAIDALSALEGRDALPLLVPLANRQHPPAVRAAAVAAIGSLDVETAAKLAVELLPSTDNEGQLAHLVGPLLGRRSGSEAFRKAFEAAKVPADVAKLTGRVLNAMGHQDAALAEAVLKAIGGQTTRPVYDPQMVKRLSAAALAQGDVTRGREVYLSKFANCTACHKVSGQGGDIGPELSTVGKSLPPEQIVESILWPNRQVKESFTAIRVITAQGQIVVGYRLKETADELHIRDTTANQVRRIAKVDIDETANIGSVMPEGLTANMTERELHDLVRYLSELGKAAERSP